MIDIHLFYDNTILLGLCYHQEALVENNSLVDITSNLQVTGCQQHKCIFLVLHSYLCLGLSSGVSPP